MPSDDVLAERVRAELAEVAGVREKRMFGGLAFLVDGHLALAASGKGGLMVRIDPADLEAALAQGARPMEMGRGPVQGWVRVDDDERLTDEELASWVETGLEQVRQLPPRGA